MRLEAERARSELRVGLAVGRVEREREAEAYVENKGMGIGLGRALELTDMAKM